MATPPTQRFIKPEDFSSKDQALMQQLAFPLNTFMQQVVSAFTKNIDFNNLNMQINTFTTSVNASGVPQTQVQFQNSLTTKLYGMIIINQLNTTNPARFPAAQPCISWTQSGSTITINNISGLGIPTGNTNSDSYTFTTLSIGQNVPNAS